MVQFLKKYFWNIAQLETELYTLYIKDDIDQSLFLHKGLCQMEEDHSGVKLVVLVSLSLENILFSLVYSINMISS